MYFSLRLYLLFQQPRFSPLDKNVYAFAYSLVVGPEGTVVDRRPTRLIESLWAEDGTALVVQG
jgi:hypothetical protein